MVRVRSVISLLMLVMAAGVAGCGGGSSTGGTAEAPKSVPMATFVTNADRVCEHGDQKKSNALEAATGAKGLKITQIEGERLISEIVLPLYRETNEELAELDPPKGHEEEVDAIVSEVRTSIAKAEAEPLLALNGKAFVQPDEAITKFGIPDCIF